MLWRGDFHNARQLLAALAHRLDRRKQKRRLPSASPREAFNLYRLAQSQRARLLNSLLVQVDAHGSIALKRAPDVKAACASVLGDTEEPFLLPLRSEEHTSELQSLMRISYAVFCLKKKKQQNPIPNTNTQNHSK